MTTTIVSSIDVGTTQYLLLNGGDSLIVASGAGIYWSDNSEIQFAANQQNQSPSSFQIFGTVSLSNFSVAPGSTMFVGSQGTISTDQGLNLGNFGDMGECSVTNNGQITSSGGMAAVRMMGGQNHVMNNGTVSGLTGVVLGQDTMGGNALINTGLVTGLYNGVWLCGNNDRVTNLGTISSMSTGIYVSDESFFLGQNIGSITQTITNSGDVWGNYTGIQSSWSLTSDSFLTITNTGTIGGSSAAIVCGVEQDVVNNSGTLNGSVYLGDGNDVFNGIGGRIFGTVNGGLGADTYYTDEGKLIINEAGSDIDVVFAAVSFRLASNIENLNLIGMGDFRGFGNSSDNQITGNDGDNRLNGLDGSDALNGGLGNDRLNGGSQDDTLYGGDDDDVLLGGTGNDSMEGGNGDDRIIGGEGADAIITGDGADRIIYTSVSQMGTGLSNCDVILDFTQGEDVINLRAIDANSTNALPYDTFVFSGSTNFHGAAGEVIFSQQSGSTFIGVDVDGDGQLDGLIALVGTYNLTAADFYL